MVPRCEYTPAVLLTLEDYDKRDERRGYFFQAFCQFLKKDGTHSRKKEKMMRYLCSLMPVI